MLRLGRLGSILTDTLLYATIRTLKIYTGTLIYATLRTLRIYSINPKRIIVKSHTKGNFYLN